MRDIVVGIDASPASEQAVDRALLEAGVGGRRLVLVNAWTTPVWVGAAPSGAGYYALPSPEDAQAASELLLEEAIAKALTRNSSTAQPVVRTVTGEGPPGAVLVRESEEAALIVVGGKGHGAASSALLGSATSYVLHHARCPVMVVPAPTAPPATYQKVIAGVDGSPSSRSALRWAHAAARRHGCPLVVVFAWQLRTMPSRPPMATVPSLAEFGAEALASLETVVAETIRDEQGVDITVDVAHRTASHGLLAAAGPDDLLVLGSRGRGGFTELLLGSVAAQCVRHARGVVVVVKADQERLEESTDDPHANTRAL
jgi:nucleotide-binding universal stress UspA family protein